MKKSFAYLACVLICGALVALAYSCQEAIVSYLKDFSEATKDIAITITLLVAPFGLFVAIWRNRTLVQQTNAEIKDVRAKIFRGGVELLSSEKSYARQGALRVLELYANSEVMGDTAAQLAVYRIISGFIQARRPVLTTDNYRDKEELGEGEKNKHDSDVDVVTAVTILRENFNHPLFNAWKALVQPKKQKECRVLEDNYMDFSNIQFPLYSNLANGVFPNSNFSDSGLEGAILEGTNLTDSNLMGTDLAHADLRGAILTGAFFNNKTLLDGARLDGARPDGALLHNAKGLTQAQVNACQGDQKTSLPDGIKSPEHWLKSK